MGVQQLTLPMRHSLTALLIALCPSLAFAQPKAIVPDPDPEFERKTFTVAPGFEVTLYAADPLLAKPIQMNFDPQGRLWVASSEIYPQIKPGEKANDKIIVLEDTNGDGKADKTTVFADGLLIPTGLEPGDGGVYVANSTELVHLSASKPGGKADKKRVLLSGFGTEDTHHIIHTFRWGPDCRLYFNQSIYIHSHIETPSGVKRLNAGGIWRFNPDTTQLDVFARGWVNAWGHAFDKYGQSLVTDGAGGEGINHAIPGGVLHDIGRAARAAHPARDEPRLAEVLRSRSRERTALPGRLAGRRDHERLPRSPRLPVQAEGRRQHVRDARDDGSDQEQPPGVPPDRREDGAGRRAVHRGLVQPDHPARRGGLPRPAPRQDARPHLACDREGPRPREAAEVSRRDRARVAGATEGTGAVDAPAGQARVEGARR